MCRRIQETEVSSSGAERNNEDFKNRVAPSTSILQNQIDSPYRNPPEKREYDRLRKEKNRAVISILQHAEKKLRNKSQGTIDFINRVLNQLSSITRQKEKNNVDPEKVKRTTLFSRILNLKRMKDEGSKKINTFRLYRKQILQGRKVADVAQELCIYSRPLHDLFRIKTKKSINTIKVNEDEKREFDEATQHSNITQPSPMQKQAGKHFFVVSQKTGYLHYKSVQKQKGKKARSFSSYLRHLPKSYKKNSLLPYEICACSICLNTRYLATSLIANSVKKISRQPFENLKMSFCEPDDHLEQDEKRSFFSYKIDCIQRSCEDCGVETLKNHILNENKNLDWEKQGTYRIYEDIRMTGKKPTTTRNMVTCSLREMLDKYIESLDEISTHIFTWVWQGSQFEEYKKNLKDGDVLMVVDFSQNYQFRGKEEVQSGKFLSVFLSVCMSVCLFVLQQLLIECLQCLLIRIFQRRTGGPAYVCCFRKAKVPGFKMRKKQHLSRNRCVT